MGQYYKPVCLDTREWIYTHKFDSGLKLMEHSYLDNRLLKVVEALLAPGGEWHEKRIVWAGDYADEEEGTTENIYAMMGEAEEIFPNSLPPLDPSFCFLVNHTKKVFIDLRKVRENSANKEYAIHPLPLLTCEGNGRGGGDFRGEDKRIGSWARDVISIEDSLQVTNVYSDEEVDGLFKESND